jgi:hypothetical protein
MPGGGPEGHPPTLPLPPLARSARMMCQRYEGKQALFRRYETFSWTACNEVTRKLTREGSTTAIGWLMNVDGKGWYGRVRDARGDWTFGPASATRAIAAVEARIRHEPFDPRFEDGERAWLGDAMWALHPPRVPICANI